MAMFLFPNTWETISHLREKKNSKITVFYPATIDEKKKNIGKKVNEFKTKSRTKGQLSHIGQLADTTVKDCDTYVKLFP